MNKPRKRQNIIMSTFVISLMLIVIIPVQIIKAFAGTNSNSLFLKSTNARNFISFDKPMTIISPSGTLPQQFVGNWEVLSKGCNDKSHEIIFANGQNIISPTFFIIENIEANGRSYKFDGKYIDNSSEKPAHTILIISADGKEIYSQNDGTFMKCPSI